MNLLLKTPVCNIFLCEDIAVNSEEKLYLFNPFTQASMEKTNQFHTYMVIQGLPNRILEFKLQIVDPEGIIIKETELTSVPVEENVIRAKTKWTNIQFYKKGKYEFRVLIKCNKEFDTVGSSYLNIT